MSTQFPEFTNLPGLFPYPASVAYFANGATAKSFAVEVIISRKSCVPGIGSMQGGVHLIIQSVVDGAGDNTADPRRYTPDELAALYRFTEAWANEHANRDENGKPLWQIARRGTGMAKRDHVHIHLVLLRRKDDIPRLIDPSIALKDLAKMSFNQIGELMEQFRLSQIQPK